MRRMYSENQLKNIIIDDVNEAIENNQIEAHKIIELDIESALNENIIKSHTAYVHAWSQENMLHFIVSGLFISKAISADTYDFFTISALNGILGQYYDRIYRADGTAVNENPTSSSFPNTVITESVIRRWDSSTGSSTITASLMSGAKNNMSFRLQLPALTEDSKFYIDFRITLRI